MAMKGAERADRTNITMLFRTIGKTDFVHNEIDK